MKDDLETTAAFFLLRAMEEDQNPFAYRQPSGEYLSTAHDVSRAIDQLLADVFDLAHEHLECRKRGDIDGSNTALSSIAKSRNRRIASSYLLNSSVKPEKKKELNAWVEMMRPVFEQLLKEDEVQHDA
jgi:hypothetical protein